MEIRFKERRDNLLTILSCFLMCVMSYFFSQLILFLLFLLRCEFTKIHKNQNLWCPEEKLQTYIVEVMRYSRVSDVVCICIQKCSCMFGRMRDVILETFLNILSRLYCVHKYEFYINYLFSSSVYSTSYYYYTRHVPIL